MSASRHLKSIAAALVAAAMFLLHGTAHAHPGPHGPNTSIGFHVGLTGEDYDEEAARSDDHAVNVQQRSRTDLAPGTTVDTDRCCCGIASCGVALLPAAHAIEFDPQGGRVTAARGPRQCAGIEPDGPRRPPRPGVVA